MQVPSPQPSPGGRGGAFSAADQWEDLPRLVQEAAEVYLEGEDIPIPAPTSLEQLAVKPEYQGGVWLLVDIDLDKLRVKARSATTNSTT